MFQPVSNPVNFPAQERDVLDFWKRTRAFERLRELRANSDARFSFIDGPITANNPMGVHHAWGRTYKDLWQRYFAMKGRNQRWQNGFDCQGLWVEVEVEKSLGLQTKRDIEAMGLDKFVRLCKERVLRMAAQQTEQSIRLGYWMDWNDPDELRMLGQQLLDAPNKTITLKRGDREISGTPEQLIGQLGLHDLAGSYFTFSDENNYQIWSFLKECFNNGWIYRGNDSIPWCPRCATGISQHEMDTEGYKEVEDPSITSRLKVEKLKVESVKWLEGGAEKFSATPNRYLLVWTTTPWTLPANVAVAVGPKLNYCIVKQTHKDGEQAIYVLSKGTLNILRGAYEVLGELVGEQLIGWTYQGLFDELPVWIDAEKTWQDKHGFDGERRFEHSVIPWDEVGEAEGTGLVHIAPGCGPEDHALGKQFGLPIVAPIDESGFYLNGFGEFVGKFASDVPDQVETNLKAKGFFYKREKYKHRYAHCWRCKSPLLYRLVDEWYISMDELRHQMMTVSEQINWIPSFGKERELDWLRNMHDWMISKKRYWGLALPIWEYPDGSFEIIGSYEELKARAVEGWEQFEGHAPHRPWIDQVKIKHPVTGLIGTRVPDVGNPWLDAGIVSFSTLGYRTDKAYWEKWFPADFITESFPGQFRNWFYSLIAMSTVLEKQLPAKTILGFATLYDEKGEAMHKSKGNAIEFNEAADKAGADSMRWLYARQRYDDNLLFGYNALATVRKELLIPLWNVYAFFVTYANADGWMNDGHSSDAHRRSSLDVWVLARLAQTVNDVNAALDAHEAKPATWAIERFIDDLSNWYVRRSRERFWREGMDDDKRAAYETLYEVLTTLCKLLAPFVPFVTEAMWQNLQKGGERREDAVFSVHHQQFPETRNLTSNEEALLRDTAVARTVVNLGHSVRAQSKVKVRQPLGRARIVADTESQKVIRAQEAIIKDELNIKRIEFAEREEELVSYKVLPDLKKLGKKLGQNLPKVREALNNANATEVAAKVRQGVDLVLSIDDVQMTNGSTVVLSADELIVQALPKAGLVVAGDTERGIVVALDTTLTDELVSEGLAREVVRRVNDLRKQANFDIADRIVTQYHATPKLAKSISQFADYIKSETLSVELRQIAESTANTSTDEFEGETLTLAVIRKQ
jgi:isoleucyl-tRNA synthetase